MTKRKYIIVDWTGNLLFDGMEFSSFDNGWDYIYSNISDADNAYDDYFVEEIKS